MEEKSKGESSSEDGMSIFNESFPCEESENENEKKESHDAQKDENNPSENDKILKCQEIFLGKKRKVLTEEEKKERTKKIIDRYCKRNDEMLKLLEKINSNEITHKNINRMMRLLAIDLSDTKKLINKKSMLHNQKKEIFQNLLNFTFQEYQYFWFQLTNGKSKKGSAQLIKSNNISRAKQILKELQEKKIKFDNDNNSNNNGEEKSEEKKNKDKDNPEVKPKKERTVKEMIQAADLRDIENKKLDEFFENESAISSDESISSSISESDDDGDGDGDDNNISNSKSSKESKKDKDKEKNKEKEKEREKQKEKEEKIFNEKKEKEMKIKKEMEEKARKEKEEKARREKEEKARKEKEEKEKKEKMKKIMEDEDEIDIFN